MRPPELLTAIPVRGFPPPRLDDFVFLALSSRVGDIVG